MVIAHTETNAGSVEAAVVIIPNHTVGGTNPVLIVKIAYRDNSPGLLPIVKWSGEESLALLIAGDNGNAQSELLFLANPTPAVNGSIVISGADSMRIVAAASTYTDVDQTNPFRIAGASSGNGATGSPVVVITANADEMVVDSLCQVSAGPDTMTGSHQERHNEQFIGGGTDVVGASQEKLSAGADEQMFWAAGGDDNWAITAGPLQQPQAAPLAAHPMLIVHSI